MSEIEKNQEEKTAKQKDSINLIKVTKDKLTDYIQCKIYVYTEIYNQLNLILQESFQGNFKDFIINIFT